MTVDEVGPGGVVGEIVLLTGNARPANRDRAGARRLARLSRADFERLAARHPEALGEFLQRILPRLRRAQLVRVLIELFGELDAPALAELERELEWVRLPGGTTLFQEGDRGDDVYIVVNGRLRALLVGGEGRTRILEEVGRGAAVGELALLTGEPRAATIVAVRDSDLLKLSRASFDALLMRHPRAMMQIARAAALRLRHSVHGTARASAPNAFALIPAGPGVPLAAFAARLAGTFKRGTVLHLASGEVDRLLAKPGDRAMRRRGRLARSLVAWLSAQEREHAFLVLEADPEWTPWTRRVLRQADRVLIVGRAGDDPAPGSIEQAAAEWGSRRAGSSCCSSRKHAHGPRARRVARTRRVATHHHLRFGRDGDLGRLARRISGRATGLVLGGGGARGFAHIGMLRALDEAGVVVDMVGGTSIGSLIAAGHAAGLSVERMVELAGVFASPRRLLDRTLPITSLMAGRKVTDLFRQLFGDLLIEDLWTPLFVRVERPLPRARGHPRPGGGLALGAAARRSLRSFRRCWPTTAKCWSTAA